MPDGIPETELRAMLTGEHPDLLAMRRRMSWIPSNPRCKLCSAPFGGVGGAVLKHFGWERFGTNPTICVRCIREFRANGLKGAEIPVTLLFADIRGSTALGERLRPAEFRRYLDRFYSIGTSAILDDGGIVDKYVGDEVIGLFFGGVSGPDHAGAAIRAGRRLLAAVGRPDASADGPIPVGAGIHTGEAYVGTTGPDGAADDFTALGDVVNSTARLASAAAAGELLITTAAADAAADPGPLAGTGTQALSPVDRDAAERRTLDIRGRHEPLEVLVLRP